MLQSREYKVGHDLLSLTPTTFMQGGSCLEAGRALTIEKSVGSTLILDFLAFRTVRNKLRLFKEKEKEKKLGF